MTTIDEKLCPNCGSDLTYYHDSERTRAVCSKKCQGWKIIEEIDRELMAEHRKLNPLYDGVPEAPLPRYPERDKDSTLCPWEHWEKQQAEAVAWVKDLEDEK